MTYETPVQTTQAFLDWAVKIVYISYNRSAKTSFANLYWMLEQFSAGTGRKVLTPKDFGNALGRLGYPSVRGPKGARMRGGIDSYGAVRKY